MLQLNERLRFNTTCYAIQSSGEIESYCENYEATFYIENHQIHNLQYWALIIGQNFAEKLKIGRETRI